MVMTHESLHVMESVGEDVPFSGRGQLVDAGKDYPPPVLDGDLLESAGDPHLVDAFDVADGSTVLIGNLTAKKFSWTDFFHRK